MFVVMGASGRVGGAVLKALSEAGQPVRALCRTPRAEPVPGVDWVSVDALDQQALTRAFEGASAAFVMNPVAPDANDVDEQAARLSASVAGALRAARLPYAVALSSQGAHLPRGTGIVATLNGFETALRGAGLPMTFLRPAYFMESWLPAAMMAAGTGEMPAFLAPLDRAIDCVSAQDVGRAAAGYLMNPRPGIVNLTGPRRYSEADAAAILSRHSGRRVTALPVPGSDIAAAHEAAGLGASFSAGIAGMYAALNDTGIPFETEGAEWSHQPTTLETVLAAAA
ncbi:NmrA family NAD(P)-binding protein [Paracoccus zhejiangensis]|uniref:NmrA-like domain-containing protein n=1 Tax=Paracoccus zhejiangensis TaxID=1077935 RepID=A0A2H5EZW5_9RHOB|nr:NmrA family NAD(P)-binding protein [Paracoccus zhejiangensis]AUH64848.1 hypothetical protein CX676_12265 [Paracoccus zhejiangensis]